MTPRMTSKVIRNGALDELRIQWGNESLLTTGKRGSFTRERINEIKRKFGHVGKTIARAKG